MIGFVFERKLRVENLIFDLILFWSRFVCFLRNNEIFFM